jgi:hypothetical protein
MVSSEKHLEGMLRRVLAPVEPSPQFVRRLRGRLVRVQGGGGPNIWTLVVVGVGLILMVGAWVGLALRLMLALVGILGLLSQRRSPRSTTRVAG